MLNIVVARYQEDIAWLDQVPTDARVYLYNKGPDIAEDTLPPNVKLIPLPNHGRESGTYIHHLRHHFRADEGDITVFTQADPFEHSPGFLQLLKLAEHWLDVQPLSVQWIEEKNIPPRMIVGCDTRDWVADLPIRTEHFSLTTWAPLAFFDAGAWGIGNTYRKQHSLPSGTNILQHFFELCGLEQLAEDADGADIGVFSYGAIFGVRHARIAAFLAHASTSLDRIELLTRADLNYGYIFERAWMHMFGESCLRLPARRSAAFDKLIASSTVQAAAAPDLVPRAVAPAASSASADINALRRSAYDAWGRGQLNESNDLLKRALLLNPEHCDVLSDLAAMAFQLGDAAQALQYASRALAVDADHTATLFTFAMCLSATGQIDGALRAFERLSAAADRSGFREESPELAALAEAEEKRLRALTQAA